MVINFHIELWRLIFEIGIFGRVKFEFPLIDLGTQVQVVFSNDDGFVKEYNFTPSSAYSRLGTTDFAPGLYRYQATVSLNGKPETVRGKFSVKELQLEGLDQVADFGLLRHLAHNTDGKFYAAYESLLSDIDNFQLKGVVHSKEDIFPIIHLKWVLFMLLAIASLEWFTRKYNGGY